ncbi:hypothetical protein FB45DRAFT_260870 [Roridomyces roridus]|uniref:Zn(2)-C6 fungal-type domain-containing protein n=1 Tax=Roridomyces roridus TaxID=1738132 RepID=A0AAD7B998_9AGAR|nr:hypothetical protein FB45DRAFT_260870 [Roridomyces roridus]
MEAARTDSTGLVPVPERSTQFFRESSRIGIEGSQLMNVARDVHIHQQPTAVVHRPPAETITTTGDTQYTPSGCYCNQMLFQGRGFPLYVPAPRGNLPAEYARQGVSIGDVGRVTPEGVFDFFFNIYLPADHPINDNDVPDNFTPLTGYDSKSVLPLDYLPEDFVSTPDSVRRMDLPSQQEFEDFLLEGSGSRGAVLAMPFGSRVEKLGNSLEQMVEYARANAESWYQHSNGTRGRRLSNGSLYLITGWEKARAWGMASFQNAAAQSPFRLAFQPVFDSNTGAYKYRWTASGPARTRTSGQIPADDAPLNQTVFIHGFSISLGTGIWGKLFKGVDISELVDSRAAQANQDYIPFGSQGFSFSWAFGFLAGGGSSGGKPHGREDPASTDAVKISDIAPVQNFVHPSAVINNYMLQKFPDAAVVMSHDNDWRDILRVDNTDQDPVSLLKSACEGFSLEEWNGLITIRRSRDKSEEDVAMVSPSEDIRGVESSSGAENDMDYQEDTQPELACICWPRGPCLCGGLRHSITLTLELHEDSQLEDLPFEMTAPTGAEGLYKAATADNSEDMDMEVAPPDLLPRSGDAPLACLFCRDRKIACGPPIGGASQVGCNQCQRRGLKCEYPMESLRGMRKKRKEQEKIPASVACLPWYDFPQITDVLVSAEQNVAELVESIAMEPVHVTVARDLGLAAPATMILQSRKLTMDWILTRHPM